MGTDIKQLLPYNVYQGITAIGSGVLVGRYSVGTGFIEQITLGAGLSLSGGGVLSAAGGGGEDLSATLAIGNETFAYNVIVSENQHIQFRNNDATGYNRIKYNTAAVGNYEVNLPTNSGTLLTDLVYDTTPQLGANLDVNGFKLVSVANGNIDIEPNGTGNVLLGNFVFDADQVIGVGQDNYVLTYDDATGLISLEPAGAGSGTVTTVSVVSANGFAGTVANPTTTPAITLTTTITGILKGNGTAISAATDSDITGSLLTGYVSGAGVVAATDTILQAIQKLNGNIAALPTYTFSTGLTDTAGTITNNLSTGIAGGQSMYGGTAASEVLTISSTTDATKGRIQLGVSLTDVVNIGSASSVSQKQLRVGATKYVDIGYHQTGAGPGSSYVTGIWTTQATPDNTNYTLAHGQQGANPESVSLNVPSASGILSFRVGGTIISSYTSSSGTMLWAPPASGGPFAGDDFVFTAPTRTSLNSEKHVFHFNMAADSQNSAGFALQRDILITAKTHSLLAAGTITDAYTLSISGAPISGTNAVITNAVAFNIAAGSVVGAGTATNSYGLIVNAQTGAANNYGGAFMGGNVGFGTLTPGAQVEVAGQIKITGGTPGADKVLTSDAAGLATWTTPKTIATDTIWDAAGDLVYGTGADTATRLAIGTANQRLRVNAGATAPEWFTDLGSAVVPICGAVVTVSATGAATNGFFAIGNQITSGTTTGGGGGTGSYQTSIKVPNDYRSGGTLKISVRKNANVTAHTVTAYINNTVDATINAADIEATATNTWEVKTVTFGSTLAAGDDIAINLNSTLSTNGNTTYVKTIQFNYNR